MKTYLPNPTRTLQAVAGNAIAEYGIVAALVLLITLPGIYLAGQNVQLWIAGLKADITRHQHQAVAVSQHAREKAKTNNHESTSDGSSDNQDVNHNSSFGDGPMVSGANGEIDTVPNKPKPHKKKPVKTSTNNSTSEASTATTPEPTPEEEPTPPKKPKFPWCSQVESGTCLEATGTPGVARKVFKVPGADGSTESNSNHGKTPLPWCSQGLPGPCNMSKKARQGAATTSSNPPSTTTP